MVTYLFPIVRTNMDQEIQTTFKFGNFKAPYLAPNIRDFWVRWHITLSSWVNEYNLYRPIPKESKKAIFRFEVFWSKQTQCPIFCFPCRTCNRIATACLPWNTCCSVGLSGRSFSWSTIRIDTVLPTTRLMNANDTGVSTPRFIKVCKDILVY